MAQQNNGKLTLIKDSKAMIVQVELVRICDKNKKCEKCEPSKYFYHKLEPKSNQNQSAQSETVDSEINKPQENYSLC